MGLRDFVKAGFVSRKNSIFVVELGRYTIYILIISGLVEIRGNFDEGGRGNGGEREGVQRRCGREVKGIQTGCRGVVEGRNYYFC